MLSAIRRTVAGWHSSELADSRKEVISLRSQLAVIKEIKTGLQKTFNELRSRYSLAQEAIVDREHEIQRLTRELADANQEIGKLTGEGLEAGAEMKRLRDELGQTSQDLARTRHELDMTSKQLELASKENELLARIHQTDIARREKELAVEKRGKTDAELAAQVTLTEADE